LANLHHREVLKIPELEKFFGFTGGRFLEPRYFKDENNGDSGNLYLQIIPDFRSKFIGFFNLVLHSKERGLTTNITGLSLIKTFCRLFKRQNPLF
jgi:hypothetical protein